MHRIGPCTRPLPDRRLRPAAQADVLVVGIVEKAVGNGEFEPLLSAFIFWKIGDSCSFSRM